MAIRYVAFVFLLFWTNVDGAKILVMATISSPSMFNLYTPIIQELAERKHDITTQSYYSLKKPLPNVKEMIIKPHPFGGDLNFTKNILLEMAAMNPIQEVYSYAEFADSDCESFVKDDTTQALLASGKQFDLVIADAAIPCHVAVASLFGRYIVGFHGPGNFPWLHSDVPMPPSYVPNYFCVSSSTMNFWERMTNAIELASFRLINHFLMIPKEQKALLEHLPQAPYIEEALDRVELLLTNADPVMYSPRPSMPNVINVGGLQTKDALPLPQELNEFVESSGDDGFIVFGLGTNMQSQFLSPELQTSILSAFSRLKQKVIWKFEAKLQNVPKNVFITKWMPQQDLLGHPKIRLFITHSGLLSLQEAIFHGVPVIGMPFFIDQPGNIGRIKELGIGKPLDFFSATEDGLYNLIQKVLTDESYSKIAKKYAAIFKDQPDKPIDRAIFWIEYVLRHGGARHFRPAGRDLNFFQYFLLDVISLLLLITALCLGIIFVLGRLVVKKVFAMRQAGKDLKKKRN